MAIFMAVNGLSVFFVLLHKTAVPTFQQEFFSVIVSWLSKLNVALLEISTILNHFNQPPFLCPPWSEKELTMHFLTPWHTLASITLKVDPGVPAKGMECHFLC
jgi:hypothetical protein